MNSLPKTHSEQAPASSRKPYMKPQMQVYGDLREITETVGTSGMMDGGTGKKLDSTAP